MLNSYFRGLGPVSLPYKARQMYMHSFDIARPTMPEGYEDYIIPVTKLLHEANWQYGEGHMTVDEKVVRAGSSQRRPRPHVDGCYVKEQSYWGHGGGWNHSCNNTGKKLGRMEVIVAASAEGCRVWTGKYDADPKSDGDLSHIQEQLKHGTVLDPNCGYLFSPDCIHESMILQQDTQRTFLRIAR